MKTYKDKVSVKTYKDKVSGETLYISDANSKAVGVDMYYKDKQMTIRHRVDGPAVDQVNGTKRWIQNNTYHRLDGPSVLEVSGEKTYYINGVYITGVNDDGDYEGPDWLQGRLDDIKGI
jgi:hypothetical protein